jgi:hypothetical protein
LGEFRANPAKKSKLLYLGDMEARGPDCAARQGPETKLGYGRRITGAAFLRLGISG